MNVNSISFKIDEFDNAAMVDHQNGEVCRILRDLANRVEEYGIVHAFEGTYLKDMNGNMIGQCECDWEVEQ